MRVKGLNINSNPEFGGAQQRRIYMADYYEDLDREYWEYLEGIY